MEEKNVFFESVFFLLLVVVYVLIGLILSHIVIEMLHLTEKVTPQEQNQIIIGAIALSMILSFFTRGIVKRWLRDFADTLNHVDKLTFISILSGIIVGSVFALPFALAFSKYVYVVLLVVLLSLIIFSFIFYVKRNEIFRLAGIEDVPCNNSYILDTSVLIDGRIVDVLEKTDLLDGNIYIPDVVMSELRRIADSKDDLEKRHRGRRGMEVVDKIKNMYSKKVIFIKTMKGLPVDEILVEEARKRNSYLVTTDFNLEHTARPQGVKVINFNEIFYLLSPPVMPGDIINVKIVKKGKEPYQGIGFLVDGTMVIVEGGESYIGRTVKVKIHNVKQTSSGRLLFGLILEEGG